jgi:hypothetical protein
VTAIQAAEFFIKMVAEGRGEYPVQYMMVEEGMTFAGDVVFELARNYDGERIWIYTPEVFHAPDWLKS